MNNVSIFIDWIKKNESLGRGTRTSNGWLYDSHTINSFDIYVSNKPNELTVSEIMKFISYINKQSFYSNFDYEQTEHFDDSYTAPKEPSFDFEILKHNIVTCLSMLCPDYNIILSDSKQQYKIEQTSSNKEIDDYYHDILPKETPKSCSSNETFYISNSDDDNDYYDSEPTYTQDELDDMYRGAFGYDEEASWNID